ncbi:ATP-binding protein [Asticcacaulis taihuensis]|uniref:histidine kinase n=1 Tax=Asticcacaulis taihuensis TaxID=260084 RepID=A0A1G4RXT1_9CAUL|nr:ATP-binding protein [Asticcacaulis taihuensis]SCW60879.1 PAS domain S-box-containing protein [Asticcacaulis taihuensis]
MRRKVPMAEEAGRHAVFHQPDIFEAEPDSGFDHLTALAADIFGAPIVLISLVDGERHSFVTAHGIDLRSIPAEISFCEHTLRSGGLMIVPDALVDTRFSGNPFVTHAPAVRFYAGQPLHYEGAQIGTFCILDTVARSDFDAVQAGRLKKLAASVSDMLALRRSGAAKKAAIRRLQETQRKLELMEEVAGVGYWHIHAPTGDCFWSRGVYAIHGLSRDSYQPQIDTAIQLFHPDDRAAVEACVGQALSCGEDFTFEHRLMRADGEERIVYSKGGAEYTEDGRPEYIFGILQDITEQAHLEETLRTAKETAEAFVMAKSDFLSNMSHEIRTPLTTILGYATLLNSVPDMPKDARHYIGRINKAGEALLSLITDILDFSKLEAGQVRLDPQPANLRNLASDIVDQFAVLGETRDIDVVCEYDPNMPDWLLLDDVRLRQVFYNLVGNACKFTQNGRVVVAAKMSGEDRLRVEVRDNGPGIPYDQQPHLFTRFNQIDNSISRKYGGSGLGLSICHEIIKLMQGRIGVESVPGEGACFWFEIPVGEAAAPAPVVSANDLKPVFLEDRKVLIVDDHPINRELIRLLMTDSGLEIHEVCDGAAALEICDRIRFDLIFMDLQMPVLDGIAATRTLREGRGLNAETAIVALSAAAQTKLSDDTRGHGFNHVLTKPIDMPQFFNILHACLEGTVTPYRLAG